MIVAYSVLTLLLVHLPFLRNGQERQSQVIVHFAGFTL
jgi:hypothetical protein